MRLSLIIGFLILFLSEILKVYFIMPFPGSQQADTIDLAYFIHQYIGYFRAIGLLILIYPLWKSFSNGSKLTKFILGGFTLLWLGVIYMFNFQLTADHMFYQPKNKTFTNGKDSKITKDKLVIGVVHNGQAKAYPIQLIGYHHQVIDTVGGTPMMITYCTVCRTGRVYLPFVNGKFEQFRLVGMDHFNAMFEDQTTGSWWQQATGEAITGKLKGLNLPSVSSEQMSLSAWLQIHPNSLVMQPDPEFKEQYAGLKNYDSGKGKSNLTTRDSLSWKPKSWVIGILMGKTAKAYDWNQLVKQQIIYDTVEKSNIIVVLENDKKSFHSFKSESPFGSLKLVLKNNQLVDSQSDAVWNMDGKCIAGKYQGSSLPKIEAYQEFWHSWQTFQPNTLIME
ncbi:DUF3179 domain-containing (seleno)protein [Flectobacillus sp. DC10W]|jgi:hypothetical protein|uniref:DUF3179 domain-containing (Seleno)protein n=1 Tax=Flectobacillus longus TaxID=2984207 RepID=A0ABT6YR29_9BACT|nr:DUF3179 domain-containing (seleno)protein [Flectobacillus longus]MDI9865616.1 DUF3179 domain-containing (seleno)protein [Flectobacillus longus]